MNVRRSVGLQEAVCQGAVESTDPSASGCAQVAERQWMKARALAGTCAVPQTFQNRFMESGSSEGPAARQWICMDY